MLVAAGRATAGAVSAQVVALTQGVLNAMFLSKLKVVGVVLITLTLAAAGAGGLFYRAEAGEAEVPAAQKDTKIPPPLSPAAAKAKLDAAKNELASFEAHFEVAAAQLQVGWTEYIKAKRQFVKATMNAEQPGGEKPEAPNQDVKPEQPARKPTPADAAMLSGAPLGNQADLIHLATAYVDAIRDLDTAKVR